MASKISSGVNSGVKSNVYRESYVVGGSSVGNYGESKP